MLKRIFRSFKPHSMSSTDTKYELWTKQQLISRIRELESPTKPARIQKPFDFSKHHQRFVAIRFAYLGWNYNGLAYQYEPTPLPTVEDEILRAMAKAKLVSAPDPGCCDFSRCGRTDKGVSAMNQVISLRVRSTVDPKNHSDRAFDLSEIPYMAILNLILPPDIRVTAISLRPPEGFDARFSCKYRHYRYLINREGLDLEQMQLAAEKYKGVHDFRNFCKIDGSKQITNFNREVYESAIIPMDDEFVIFDLKGLAFLWHQVRCMVAVLLSVGQKLENPSIVDQLLDVEKYPTKPQFEMANDIPLVLYDCVFPDMEWLYPVDLESSFNKNMKEFARLKGYVMDLQLKAHIGTIMKSVVIQDEDKLEHQPGSGTMNIGDGKGRNFKKYVPILERDFGESYEVVNERHRAKKRLRDEK